MVKIVCARCALGDVDASPERIGWGICCAPPPQIAAQIAAQAAARLQDALSAAESSDIVLADPATPAEGAEGVCERLRPGCCPVTAGAAGGGAARRCGVAGA
jgi:hypothetical protein